ncbi:trimethylguanosine synthase-like [Metopolophium dirhodum]|uniref:trimethylguanosine synthase-like n=1 Tax=Metopolophium dirhodum TaxID=44670 RepID=UPI00299067C5|nr:trimethylguanosine synthase-like [Metopolophium dirhodum]
MAEKCDRVKVAVDPFYGAGENIIQLARLFDKVIAVDIDVDKIVMAKQNAAIYGVLEKIEFVVGDFFKLTNQIKGDVIVTSPQWGGPEYNKMDVIEDVFMDRYLNSTLL